MRNRIYILAITSLVLLFAGCVKDLDQFPHTDTTSKDVYNSVGGYESVLSGIYTSMIINQGNISSDDRFQNYTRALLMFQECSTDALDIVWEAGESMTDVHSQSWNAGDPWVSAIYYHIYNIVSLSNEFIRNATDDKISNFSSEEQTKIRGWRAEARALRALAYYHAMDLFPVVSFVTESDPVGSFIPTTYNRQQIFTFLEGELQAIGEILPRENYGHATRATAWALLARIYLNAEVYTGEERYTDCVTYCKKVIEDGFTLESEYSKLFNADNHKRTNEIIFSLACNSTNTVAWGAGTFLVCAPRFDSYDGSLEEFGVASYWNTLRAKPQLVDLFESGDTRAIFVSKNRKLFADAPDGYYEVAGDTEYKYQDRDKEILAHDDVTTGWAPSKWTNLTDDGAVASDTRSGGAETDFPVFRLSDVYLMLAEAVVRGGSGATTDQALGYINHLRERAYGDTSGNISTADMTLDFLLDERGRELYMEAVRRTDLIRFGKYTSGYNWNWKGGTEDGKDVAEKYIYLPIPEAELSANPALKGANTAIGF